MLRVKRFLVGFLAEHCLHHPGWYLGFTHCGMAMLSYRLDKYWNLGEWKKNEEEKESGTSSTSS